MSSSILFPDGFIPFLPRDNGGFDEPESEAAIEAINEDLGCLLKLPPADFWAIVKNEQSLPKCLDSYLRFKKRSFDLGSNSGQISRAASQMFQRVFLVVLRLVTSEAGPGAPETSTQADIIYENWILDIPKILDVCVLYGAENQDLVKNFLQKLFYLQPKYHEDLAGIVPLLVHNIEELQNSCWDNLPETRMGQEAVLAGWPGNCLTLKSCDGFRSCHLRTLMAKDGYENKVQMDGTLLKGGGQLLACLAHVHDYLIPDLAAALGNLKEDNIKTSSVNNIQHIAQMTFVIIQRLSFIMLKQAYLRSDLDSTGQSLQVAEGRGEALMTTVLAIAQLDDKNQHNTLLHQIHKKYDLGSSIRTMIEEGILCIDEPQYEYMCMLMGYTKQPDRLHANEPGPSSSAPPEVYDTFLTSCISRVKEVLPDYEDDYIAACLKECGLDPTKVIQRLLDGSLSINMDQEHKEWPSLPGAAAGQPGAPKSIVEPSSSIFPTSFIPDPVAESSTSENAIESNSLINVRQWAQVAVGTRKPGINRKTAKVLNSLDSEMKDRVLRQADILLEYEDEYDDSFDDLITMGADGVADAEGDDQLTVSQAIGRKYPETIREGSQRDDAQNPVMKGRNQKGKKHLGKKLWLLNGKIYNYHKEGAREVESQEEADQIIKTEDEEIHGLGAGGNKPVRLHQNNGSNHPDNGSAGGSGASGHQGAYARGAHGNESGRGRGRGHGRGRGRSHGNDHNGEAGGGGGRGYGRKGQRKASIGNHNRKDRALKKMT